MARNKHTNPEDALNRASSQDAHGEVRDDSEPSINSVDYIKYLEAHESHIFLWKKHSTWQNDSDSTVHVNPRPNKTLLERNQERADLKIKLLTLMQERGGITAIEASHAITERCQASLRGYLSWFYKKGWVYIEKKKETARNLFKYSNCIHTNRFRSRRTSLISRDCNAVKKKLKPLFMPLSRRMEESPSRNSNRSSRPLSMTAPCGNISKKWKTRG
jgi:hypothetical protein